MPFQLGPVHDRRFAASTRLVTPRCSQPRREKHGLAPASPAVGARTRSPEESTLFLRRGSAPHRGACPICQSEAEVIFKDGTRRTWAFFIAAPFTRADWAGYVLTSAFDVSRRRAAGRELDARQNSDERAPRLKEH